jgi:hypothetical protein
VVGHSQPGTPRCSSPTAGTSSAPSSGKPGKPGKLSQVLSNVPIGDDLQSVAFKSLPVDPGRWRVGGGGEGTRGGPGPETCKEAVEAIVVEVGGVCEDGGAVDEGFITEEDIVRCVGAAWCAWHAERGTEYGHGGVG